MRNEQDELVPDAIDGELVIVVAGHRVTGKPFRDKFYVASAEGFSESENGAIELRGVKVLNLGAVVDLKHIMACYGDCAEALWAGTPSELEKFDRERDRRVESLPRRRGSTRRLR